MKKFIFFIIILAAGIAIGVYFQKQSKTQKIETKVQTDAAQAVTDVKEGAQKVDAVATNVAAEVKAGAQKVRDVTTNAVGEIKAKLN